MKEEFNLLWPQASGLERQRETITAARSRQVLKALGAMLYEMVTGRFPFWGFISGQAGQCLGLLFNSS